MKGFKIILLLLITVLSVQLASSETVTIQDSDDITLINSAYANNKLTPQTWKPANHPTIVVNMWKC